AFVGLGAEPEVVRRVVPEMPSLELKSTGKLNLKVVPECSALWASPSQPGVFWTLSDSGNKPIIVPIRADGSSPATSKGPWISVALLGAKNTDWEAITGDAAGNMIVGDVGNNVSRRKELSLLLFKEPAIGATEVTEVRKIAFIWPDQAAFPDPELAHDCEAMFLLRGKLYLLTKHRRDTLTDLWRAEIPATGDRAILTKLARFDIGGMVTDACLSPDLRRLAILTYRNVWVFDVPAVGEDFFHQPARYAPIAPPILSFQVEGCSWIDAGHLLLGSEQGDLFRIALTDLREVK
ncbi:MAG: hypothetical protein EBR83_00150, partial [Verrucomicrobia bacterium]|nr:hypothetical protein [Verrucomicrobiota bacterium]